MLHYLEDLEADFRVFYRMEPADMLELSGPQFLALAHRATAYAGVMAARVMAEQDEHGPSTKDADGTVESTPAALQQDPALSDLIDYG